MRQVIARITCAAIALGLFVSCVATEVEEDRFTTIWSQAAERTWIGRQFWANRLQDWRLAGGRLECVADEFRLPMRTVHLLTERLADRPGEFWTAVVMEMLDPGGEVATDAAAGFLIGAGGAAMDYRSAMMVHDVPGPGGGIFAGIDALGRCFILDNEKAWDRPPVEEGEATQDLRSVRMLMLGLKAEPLEGGNYRLRLSATWEDESESSPGDLALDGSEFSLDVPASRLAGGVALVSHPGTQKPGAKPGRFRFHHWVIAGPKVEYDGSRALGPILSSQYTLSEGTLKMTAQMMPLGEDDNQTVRLEVQDGSSWKQVAETEIVRPGFTAPLRVEGWDATRDVPYRIVYDLKEPDLATGKERIRTCRWTGTIRRDPVDKETIVVAGFTGNHNNSHRIGAARRRGENRRPFDWVNLMWFPHADLTEKVAKHDPDVLFFSGDQVYEGDSPSFPDAAHIQLDYLYKWYLWCIAYRGLTRDIPAVTMPDDHDVYQGNLWGEGGRKTDKDDKGGYVHPAEFVQMVERTQTSHLPDPFDPRPAEQGIGVYFTRMRYGRIGFAVLEDRKFKSGCSGRIDVETRGRADHINDPDFDMRKADVPGLKLLGDRQIAFLKEFAADWSGEEMKIALSQTTFAGMATHHGGNLFRLIADLDSNGWPQSGRNRALDALRRGFTVHLAGDQHLASLVQHGIDDWGDAIWAFCVPSAANFYPRAWSPEAEGKNRSPGAPPHLGDHLDGLGNKVTVYAVTNPAAFTGESTGREPLDLHDKMPGYGIVRLDKRTREITMECWPRGVDPDDPSTGRQYPGWPKTVSQMSNYDRKAAAFLPVIECVGMTDPVVQVVEESTGEIVYTLRIQGTTFRPKVFAPGKYTLSVGEPGTPRCQVIRGVEAFPPEAKKTLRIEL
ncbi:MAG: alkaline phosphatase D family protein [Planctomycetes bacterium]|nr:alkaline phosphatase D family protein [Planctomycetota bacterium]